jgi:hypothetical protein
MIIYSILVKKYFQIYHINYYIYIVERDIFDTPAEYFDMTFNRLKRIIIMML